MHTTTKPEFVMPYNMFNRLERIADQRGVFRAEAYRFVLEALGRTEAEPGDSGHISGGDLLLRIRELGGERYGALAGDVFNAWGVRGTEDFGRIVFHLVDEGLLNKRDEDTLADFIDKFDFERAFAPRAMEERA